MIQYPVKFSSKSSAPFGIQVPWNIVAGDHELVCAIPPEFEGAGTGLSPEDLFLHALTNCFVATFKVYAEKSRVSFERVEVESELIVDKNESGQPVMKNFHASIVITGASNQDRATTLVRKSFESGFILNSVTTKIEYELKFN